MLFNQSMTPDQIQTEVLKIVCTRFLNLKQATPRRTLVVKFQNPDVITEIAGRALMRETGNRGEEQYLPNSASFALCGDSDFAKMAKTSVMIVLRVLKNMFEVETEKMNYAFDNLFEHARRMYDLVDEDTLRLGLYLCQDFPALNSWGTNQGSTEVTNFSISENVLRISSPEDQWEAFVKTRSERKPMPSFSAGSVFSIGTAADDPFLNQQGFEGGFDWALLHPIIREAAESRFRSGHFADSVEAALKSVNERVRDVVKGALGIEMDGSDLMQRAFSKNSPVLKLGDLGSTTGRNMQVGYLQIFAGAMTGIRNPKAHGNIVIDAVRATHFLFLASLLMFKIDEAEVIESKAKTEHPEGPISGEPEKSSPKPS